MINGKTFAMFFNASPRRNWNTHKMLEAARAGAEAAGAETELVNLYDIKFPGCRSCFACKLKNAKTDGDTYQFTDYSRYDITLFDEAAKRAHRDAQFETDLAHARALGRRLVERAAAQA